MTKINTTPTFYILKEEGFETVKQFVEPLEQELKDANNAIKWGMTKGIVSLVKATRTSTLYWTL